MAEAVLLKDCKIYFGPYDLTGSCRKASIAAAKAALENGRFADTVEAKKAGLQQVDASVGGFWTADGTSEPDDAFWPRLNPTVDVSAWPLTIAPPYAPAAAAGADGNIAYSVRGGEFTYQQGAAHGELVPFEVQTALMSEGVLSRATIIQPKGLVSATTTGTGRELGLLATGYRLIAHLHVFAINGGSWVLTIESDDNSGFATPTTRATFTAMTAIGSATKDVAGPVATDTYWRAVMTKTGGTSLTYAVVLSVDNRQY